MRGDRLAGPHGTWLGRGLVADREHEIEARAIGRGELVPAFGSQILGLIFQLVQQIERQRMHDAFGMAPRTEASEFSLAPPIDGALGHDAAR